MKKVILSISILLSAISFSSCNEELSLWQSSTSEYAGRYVVRVLSEDMTKTYLDYDGSEFYVYNTAEDQSNKLWIEDVSHFFPLKCQYSIVGDAGTFKSATTDFAKLYDNTLAISIPTDTIPKAEGITYSTSRDYVRSAVLDAKLISKGATTKGGNKSDSIYMKIALYSGSASFVSYKLPESKWADPKVPQYSWKFSSVSYDSTKDEIYVVTGYRYTGFSEDAFH